MPSPNATILNYLNDREKGRHYFFVGFCPPNAPQTTPYLTSLMTEIGGTIIFCRVLAPHNATSPDATILDYLNDKERGRPYL